MPCDNANNLIPNDARTPSERRENARKAGKASGESRRRKRDLKKTLETVLKLPVRDTDEWNKLSAMGIDPDAIDNQTAIVCALVSKALGGDVAAFKEIRNVLGQDSDAGRLKIQQDEFKLKKSKESTNNNGKISELIEGLKDDLHE